MFIKTSGITKVQQEQTDSKWTLTTWRSRTRRPRSKRGGVVEGFERHPEVEVTHTSGGPGKPMESRKRQPKVQVLSRIDRSD